MKKSAAPKMRWVAKDASKEAPPIQNNSTEKGKAAKGKGAYGASSYDDSGGPGDAPRKRGQERKGGKGGEKGGLAKGAGKSKGMSAKVPGAKTMQEVEAEMIKPKSPPSGQETASQRPMDATGGYTSQQAWTGGQCGCGGMTVPTAAGTMPPVAPMGAPPRPVIQEQFPQSGLAHPGMVAGGVQQQAMYRPVVAQPMGMDTSQAYGFWMQQQQQPQQPQYAQQMAISSPSPAAAMQMGADPQQQTPQQGVAAAGYMSYDAAWQAPCGQATQAEMTRPLPKPMKIVDPSNGHALETREMNFKAREPRRPLPIIDPKSGESINQQSGDGSSS